ncbi:GTPase family protein [Yersinia ruckeri]|uniref:GTPase family protein n=1 Tax=Yersinia ruckeri TaxID=29486 RepID=UPI0020BEE88F|nr:GTPase family protein [Yersinia ruckeri]EKN3345962.1 GTPase family protein [Yersinia ruckeri]ELM3748293.1 GTPase family protein [Yersinia ruckeri]MCK8562352.1 GTPase family protein [Yersinia ruckeri]MCW6549069.1 GTPase family protein [Yersinia ruckeri]MCW6633220.1 GTPase family protein [Yersinia ruckeri]
MNKSDGLQAIEKPLFSLPHTFRSLILERLQKLTHYEPVIGIMGKTGSGKSSLCNALFQGEVTPVSDVNACTRDVLRLRLSSGDHSLILVDLPGVGESEQRDSEYESLYRKVLPDLDLILWVIKADDRAFSVDERFYRDIIGPHRGKVLFVVNQADKIEPCDEWDAARQKPSPLQKINLSHKLRDIRSRFSPNNPVCAISAKHEWGLVQMVDNLMRALPAIASSPFQTQLNDKLRSHSVKESARTDFGKSVGGVLDKAAMLPFIPEAVRALILGVRDTVVSVARAIWDFFF